MRAFLRVFLLVFAVLPAWIRFRGSNKAVRGHKIKSLDHQWANAYVQKDFATLDRLISDDLITTDPRAPAFSQRKAAGHAGPVKSGDVVYKNAEYRKHQRSSPWRYRGRGGKVFDHWFEPGQALQRTLCVHGNLGKP